MRPASKYKHKSATTKHAATSKRSISSRGRGAKSSKARSKSPLSKRLARNYEGEDRRVVRDMRNHTTHNRRPVLVHDPALKHILSIHRNYTRAKYAKAKQQLPVLPSYWRNTTAFKKSVLSTIKRPKWYRHREHDRTVILYKAFKYSIGYDINGECHHCFAVIDRHNVLRNAYPVHDRKFDSNYRMLTQVERNSSVDNTSIPSTDSEQTILSQYSQPSTDQLVSTASLKSLELSPPLSFTPSVSPPSPGSRDPSPPCDCSPSPSVSPEQQASGETAGTSGAKVPQPPSKSLAPAKKSRVRGNRKNSPVDCKHLRSKLEAKLGSTKEQRKIPAKGALPGKGKKSISSKSSLTRKTIGKLVEKGTSPKSSTSSDSSRSPSSEGSSPRRIKQKNRYTGSLAKYAVSKSASSRIHSRPKENV